MGEGFEDNRTPYAKSISSDLAKVKKFTVHGYCTQSPKNMIIWHC